MSRHSAGHKVPPHRVNYRGMALACQALGIKACLSTAAVGSVREEWGPGTLVVCSDFLDFTYRNITLFDQTVVHRDFSEPFATRVRNCLIHAGSDSGSSIEPNGVYLSANGPRYETPQEIETFRQLGGDVVGMTAASEAIAMREAEVEYGCLAIVTNYAAGMTSSQLDHEEVIEEMARSGDNAIQILLKASRLLEGVS